MVGMHVSVVVNWIVTVTSGDHCTTINSEGGGVADVGTRQFLRSSQLN